MFSGGFTGGVIHQKVGEHVIHQLHAQPVWPRRWRCIPEALAKLLVYKYRCDHAVGEPVMCGLVSDPVKGTCGMTRRT
jgi:hypothetical protein